jgi:transcription elongation factor Elf1
MNFSLQAISTQQRGSRGLLGASQKNATITKKPTASSISVGDSHHGTPEIRGVRRQRSNSADSAGRKDHTRARVYDAAPHEDNGNDKSKNLPGRLLNCAECARRFTVTHYNKTGPDGGFLCNSCGKKVTMHVQKEEQRLEAGYSTDTSKNQARRPIRETSQQEGTG